MVFKFANRFSNLVTHTQSGLPHENVDRHMFGDNLAIFGGQFTQAETVINNVTNNRGVYKN